MRTMKQNGRFFATLLAGIFISIGLPVFGQPNIPRTEIPKNINLDVKENIIKLYSADPKERYFGAAALGDMGAKATSAVPFLAAMLDDDFGLQLEPFALGYIEYTSPGKSAAKALGKIQTKEAIEALTSGIYSENSKIRANSASGLGLVKDKSSLSMLVNSLKDKNIDVRANAAEALGWLKYKAAIVPLIEVLNDVDRYVRRNAQMSLERITGKSFGDDVNKWEQWYGGHNK